MLQWFIKSRRFLKAWRQPRAGDVHLKYRLLYGRAGRAHPHKYIHTYIDNCVQTYRQTDIHTSMKYSLYSGQLAMPVARSLQRLMLSWLGRITIHMMCFFVPPDTQKCFPHVSYSMILLILLDTLHISTPIRCMTCCWFSSDSEWLDQGCSPSQLMVLRCWQVLLWRCCHHDISRLS